MSSQTIWPSTVVNVSPPGPNAARWCADLLARFDELGIADAHPEFTDACQRVAALATARASARIDLSATVTAAARRLATGELSIDEAGAYVAQAERDDRAAEMSAKVLSSAIAQAGGMAVATLAAEGDRLLEQTFAPLLAEVVDEWAELAPRIPADVDTDTDAMHAPAKVRDAWARLLDLERRAALVWSTVDQLRGAGAIATPRKLHGTPVGEFRWRHPERLPPRSPRGFRPHPVEVLTAALASGAGPDVLTAAEVLERSTDPREAA